MDSLKSIMEKIEERNLPLTLKQGLNFKKYQQKITTNPRAVAIANDLEEKKTTIQGADNTLIEENEQYSSLKVEGFTSMSGSLTNSSGGGPISQQILSQLSELDNLQTQYNSLIEQYKTANATMLDNVKTTINNSTKNPYANTNVKLSDGKSYYVTRNGVVKLYDSSSTYTATSGKNGCPSDSTTLNMDSISNAVKGSNMVSGQSCGNEGSNVYVNKILNTPSATYIGCFNDSNTLPAMTSVNDGNKLYNYATCQEAALNSGSSYFGLQGLDTSSNLASCYVSNDLSTAKKYGEATTLCNTDSEGNIYGNTLVNAIYKSPDAKYVGTYNDDPTRAMTFVNDGSNTFTYETCKQQAIKNNSSYFGLQNFSSSTQTAQCAISSDFTTASKYGKSSNYSVGKDNKIYGGEWANSIYQVETDLPNYRGCYNDKAESPAMTPVGDGSSTYSVSTCKNEAVMGGNKFFALQGGSSGTSKCFVSNDFSSAKKYGKAVPCNRSTVDKKTYGNNGVNAIYQMSEVGDVSAVGKLGYVDSDANVTEFPDSMIMPGSTYNKYENYSTSLSSIDSLENATYDSAVSRCNSNTSCYGFTLDSSTNMAQFYGKGIVLPSTRILKPNTTLYVRNLSIQNLNSNCNKTIVSIDSNQWKNYVKKSGYMSPSSTCDLSNAITSASTKSNTIQMQIVVVAKKIIAILNNLNKQNETVNNRTGLNTNIIQANLQKYNDVVVEMSEFTDVKENNINNILQDSDIKVLQENYGYMFWSILAIATVIITMNIVRKK